MTVLSPTKYLKWGGLPTQPNRTYFKATRGGPGGKRVREVRRRTRVVPFTNVKLSFLDLNKFSEKGRRRRLELAAHLKSLRNYPRRATEGELERQMLAVHQEVSQLKLARRRATDREAKRAFTVLIQELTDVHG